MNTIYNVHTTEGRFILSSTLPTIGAIFKMHRDAVNRVARELETKLTSLVHFNGRPALLGLQAIEIEKA